MATLTNILLVGGALMLAGKTGAPRRRGVWWDLAPSDTLDNLVVYLDRMEHAKINEVAVMAQSPEEPTWNLRWSPEQLRAFGIVLRTRGIPMTITVWPQPTRAYIDGMFMGSSTTPKVQDLVSFTQAAALELDVESNNWTSDHLDGFTSMTEAAQVLASGLLRGIRVPVGTTTYPYGLSSGSTSVLCRMLPAFCAVQAYSRWRDGDRPWDSDQGPGHMQRLAYEKAKEAGIRNVILGLAAWDQDYASHDGNPEHTPEEAMRVAYEAAKSIGVMHVRYWSAKHLLRASGSGFGYGNRFLSTYPV